MSPPGSAPARTVGTCSAGRGAAARGSPPDPGGPVRRASASSLLPGEEHALVLAAARGDPAARDRLVEAFFPSIGGMARRYQHSGAVDRGELMQEGVVGLLRALGRFDPERGTPFWAYASWWVRQAMQRLVSGQVRPVVLSDRALRQLARIKAARREHLQAEGRDPSLAELAAATGLPRAQMESLIAVDRMPRAMEEPLGYDEDSVGVLGDMIADPRAEEAYDKADRQLEVTEMRQRPSPLSEREQSIVRARYGLDGHEQTLRQIASRLGLSAERVRQIEERALEKLRITATVAPPAPPSPAA